MKTLQRVIERIVEDAMRAGAEGYMIGTGTDSAVVGRQYKAWVDGPNYPATLWHQRQRAIRDVSVALMQMRLAVEVGQKGLFEEGDG